MKNRLRVSSALRERGEATRQRLLDEAERQFAEYGFRGTTLSGIAGACGLGNAGALHHFPSKEKLYKAVLQRLSQDFEADMQSIIARHGSPAGRLRAVLRHHAAEVIGNPQRSRLILRELMDNLGRVERAKSLPMTRYVATFCRLIEDARAIGAAAPGPAIVLLAQFLGTLSYALVVRPTFARMEVEQELLQGERHWIEAIAGAAERALLGAGSPGATLAVVESRGRRSD